MHGHAFVIMFVKFPLPGQNSAYLCLKSCFDDIGSVSLLRKVSDDAGGNLAADNILSITVERTNSTVRACVMVKIHPNIRTFYLS